MRIQIRHIGLEGMDLQESFPADIIEIAQDDPLRFVAPFEIAAKVISADDEVVAMVTAKSSYASFCSRCLEEIEREWAVNFTLTFNAKEHSEFIDVDEDIRQELILNLPVRTLCQADCKGLCIDCGENLNKQECKHKHAVTDVNNKP